MIKFMGKELEKPLIASSCIATENTKNVLRLVQNGIQGAILKSCANYCRSSKVTGKRQFAVDSSGYTYASSPFEKEILTLEGCITMMKDLRPKTDILLIPSFTASGLSPSDWIPACEQLENAGADAIQLDFFYMGCIIGSNNFPQRLVSLLEELRKAINIPIMPKLNINLPKDFIMPLIVKADIEYVSLLDSVRSPYFEAVNNKYRLSDRLDAEMTSCFGHWQLPLTLSYTYTAAKYGLKVCAGGGITDNDDIEKLLAAGAVTVQSATYLTKHYKHL
ncbi:MAG: hypothetical protein IJ736_04450 [Firmicutes bacterium]|nr:hypothetical protein [Bacillota bacterium]